MGDVELYFLHDIHVGAEEFDSARFEKLKKQILSEDNRFVVWLGDVLNNAIPGSKTEMFDQTMPPHEQKEWFCDQLRDFDGRNVLVVPGNHEYNRSTKAAGLYPLYDCCARVQQETIYRKEFAFLDIGVGERQKDKNQQNHYVGFCVHQAKDLKSYSSADWIDGIDWMAFGHDHEPKSRPRAKLVYNPQRKLVTQRDVEVVNSGSFLRYGGYGAKGGYRPQAAKMYKIILGGAERSCTSSSYSV
jgi:predicted phosphodiesterase